MERKWSLEIRPIQLMHRREQQIMHQVKKQRQLRRQSKSLYLILNKQQNEHIQ